MTDPKALDARPLYVAGEISAATGPMPRLRLEAFPVELANHFGAAFAGITPWADYDYPAERLAAYFAGQEPGAPRLLIRAGDEPAGVVGLRNQWLRGPYLQFLGITPKFQNQAIGGAVLTWWESEARSSGERNLWLTVSEINVRARAFYARNGFVEAAGLKDLVVDARCELLLRKRLQPS